jgi:DNA-binding MarR family transcriptional regulator
VAQVREPEGIGAWRNLLRAHAAVVGRIARDVEARTGLPLTWYDALLEVNSALPDRKLRIQDLSERVVFSRSRLSRVVDEMVRAGLVRREPDPSDGRAAFAVITADGRAALRRAAPVYLRDIEEHFLRHLAPDERTVIATALGRVAAAEGVDTPVR